MKQGWGKRDGFSGVWRGMAHPLCYRRRSTHKVYQRTQGEVVVGTSYYDAGNSRLVVMKALKGLLCTPKSSMVLGRGERRDCLIQ